MEKEIQHKPRFNGRENGADGVVEFDYGFVEREMPDSKSLAADALRDIWAWFWEQPNFKVAFLKFVAVTGVMRPELLDSESYAQIGKKLNCSRSNISRLAIKFQDAHGVHYRRSKRDGAREKYSAARFTASA